MYDLQVKCKWLTCCKLASVKEIEILKFEGISSWKKCCFLKPHTMTSVY